MKKVVVTGATGMIGISLINLLISKGIHVLAIVRPNSPRRNILPVSDLINVLEWDLHKLPEMLLEDKDQKYDCFFHLGWSGTFGDGRNNMYLQNANIKMTIDAVYLAEKLGCSVFVGAGSQAEYGVKNEEKLNANLSVDPENGYGIAKYCAGKMSRVLCNQLDIRHVWVRILSIYGPCDGVNTMIMSSISKMLQGNKMQYTKAEQMWDYLYVDDAALGLYLSAQKGKNNSVYVLGSGVAKPLSEYINAIRNNINPNIEINFGDIPYSVNQVMYLCGDISDLTKDTEFLPRISFEEGIRKTIDWYKGGELH